MRVGWICRVRRLPHHDVTRFRRPLSTQSSSPVHLSRTRNIGIIAHIDAGKTTTTERMLYYSGHTRRIGDVDEGSTVTDFLPAERARGITIQSAAITFQWPPSAAAQSGLPPQDSTLSFETIPRSSVPHNINLIDTPGHADFTFEVLRSLRVLDGAVCILDGVAGVEAQTEKVWIQAGSYHIPRIIFVNKLDRDGAAFSRTVKEVGTRLHGWPAVCQIPWWKGGNGSFVGVGDVIHLRGLLWQEASDGLQIQASNLEELQKSEPSFAQEIRKARTALVELLSEHDDGMVELFLEHDEDHLAIPGTRILQSLRRIVLHRPQVVIPIFAGASFRNIGVQPLLDATVDLLPSPLERPDPEISLEARTGTLASLLASQSAPPPKSKTVANASLGDNIQVPEAKNLQACALAFKVVNDAKRGILVYVRVYSGSIDKGNLLFNTNLNTAERAPRLFKMYANDAVEVDSIQTGQIGVITGLKHARTGDTLVVYRGLNPRNQPPGGLNTLQLRPIHVPPPVFFTSIEPYSLSEQKHVLESLAILLREDPSLQLSVDEESGQTHLAGMGDLHLEIARDRLLNDFKAKARIGKIEIGYRETVTTSTTPYTHLLERLVANKPAKAAIAASISSVDEPVMSDLTPVAESLDEDPYTTIYKTDNFNTLTISHAQLSKSPPLHASNSGLLPPTLPLSTILSSIHAGASAALARGPLNNYPLANTHVHINFDASAHIFPETTGAAISMATRAAVAKSLRDANQQSLNTLMEPVMRVTVFVNEESLGAVVQDLSSARGGQVLSLELDNSTSATSSSISASSSEMEEDLPSINPNQIYTPPDPFSSSSGEVDQSSVSPGQRQIIARVPLKEMVGYLNHLRALTGGRGTFVMNVDGFEKMSGQRQREVLDGLREF